MNSTIRKDTTGAYEVHKEFVENDIEYSYDFKLYPDEEFMPYDPAFHRITFEFMNIRFVVSKNFNTSRYELMTWIDNLLYYIRLFGLSHIARLIDRGDIRFSNISFNPFSKKHTISMTIK